MHSSIPDIMPNTILIHPEPILDGVLEEDRPNVRNVIYVLHSLKLCQSWSVTPNEHAYEITGSVDTKANTTIELRDMELIRKVDPLRINSIGTRVIGGCNPTVAIVINVNRKSEPIILEEQEIVQIQRKRKFWSFSHGL